MATQTEWALIRHFEPSEFDAKDEHGNPIPGTGAAMDYEFLRKLDQARHEAKMPFSITSGVRTPERNDQVGGADDSAHLRKKASDVKAATSGQRFKIVRAALLAGFRRIGVYKTHVHVDSDDTLPQGVFWLA